MGRSNIYTIHDFPTKIKRNLTHINEVALEYDGGYDDNEDSADYYAQKPVKAVRLA